MSIGNAEAQNFLPPIEKTNRNYSERISLTEHTYTNGNHVKTPTYYFVKAYRGELHLTLSLKRPHNDVHAIPHEIPTALYLMITHGTLGAYDQYGCGAVRFASKEDESVLRSFCLLEGKKGESVKGVSLRDFFFFKGQMQSKQFFVFKGMAEIRYRIRNAFRGKFTDEQRHWFCGSLGNTSKKEDPSGTKYMFSVNAKGDLYGWGYYPRSSGLGYDFLENRENILTIVRNVLAQKDLAGKSLEWWECASTRDTKKVREWPEFYKDLLCDTWRNA